MAPAYKNVTSGQIVVSDEPRPDLEAQARWDEVPVPDEPVPPASSPMTEAELAEAAAREAAADPSAVPPASDALPTVDPAAPSEQSIEIVSAERVDEIAGDPAEPVGAQPDEVPVPDETWTDEALDALGKERGITWRANASKATKVAKLTAPAAE